jgi:DNA-binding response OmpR family regulator
MKKILLADVPPMRARLSRILERHELSFAGTLDQAVRAIAAKQFDLLVVDVHFDESRMFDLLRQLRRQSALQGAPIVCVLGQGFESAAITVEGLEIAAKALECSLFIDFSKFSADEAGDAEIRRQIEALL